MPSACLSLYTPTASMIPINSKPKPFSFHTPTAKKFYGNPMTCKAFSSSSSSSSSSSTSSSAITDFDLYDLLGIDSSSDQSQIKRAYRSLQKRCHPDIAGGPGHDMAIVLNEAYSILSDPISRFAYDKEQAKTEELKGYTGKPLYSVWLGPESEQRACFVDEVKCVGCLKCALFAEKTFAIESVYGRARVVAQWADPEHKIQEAIESCPVDCISMVERSNLAALEFIMSKQPRGNVRLSSGNTVGARVSNIFVEVDKFQTKYRNSIDKTSQGDSMETDLQRKARMSAIQAIRSISNWFYWQSPTSETCRGLTHIARNKFIGPDINKLREAANAMKQARDNPRTIHQISSTYALTEEYWTPSNLALPAATTQTKTDSGAKSYSSPTKERKETNYKEEYRARKNRQSNPLRGQIPMGMAVIGAVVVRLQEGGGTVGGLEEHIGGSLALEMVNSSWSHVILAGIPWYCIGMVLVGLVEALQRKDR